MLIQTKQHMMVSFALIEANYSFILVRLLGSGFTQ